MIYVLEYFIFGVFVNYLYGDFFQVFGYMGLEIRRDIQLGDVGLVRYYIKDE